ncbi:MAG TPA: Dyp-type peroxidase [Polyangia bacterium]|jgi:putative iron-dependent peroxidase|nr:Dyp-type peroxidase [Polyangia bacterium]
MTLSQPAILEAAPPLARHVSFALHADADPEAALRAIGAAQHDPRTVIGVGTPLVERLGRPIAGLRAFPDDLPPFPSTQLAAWAFLAHGDATRLFDAGRELAGRLRGLLDVVDEVDAFAYRDGRDLSGFVDGTENPKGEDAVRAAIIAGRGSGLDGGSFVAVQRWVHDLDAVARMTAGARSSAIGRDLETNDELEDAPASAHVKRTAQESFDPPAFVVRRSMPYGGIREHGLNFVAFGESLDRFERQLRRMAGRDDGIPDGILSFTRAVTGAYYFCPPLRQGRLDLRALGV